ncbi:MAG: C39 family peptidase [bacterium]|nr:C39 family peptidase [bacterium]
MKRLLIMVALLAVGSAAFYAAVSDRGGEREAMAPRETKAAAASGTGAVAELPAKKDIEGLSHVFQTFNNCSSVALLIALSRWGIDDTQERIAAGTRPWNNPKGDNDDKSVTLYELADYSAQYGLATYVRPNGDLGLLKQFVANDIPVIARALTYADKDYVHYRVARGYDEDRNVIIESDGIEGPNEEYSYDKWMHLWKDFNYSYLIVVPLSKQALVEEILGDEKDAKTAWRNAKERAETELKKDANDLRAHYNLVTALYYLGDYKGTVREFEKIEPRLTEHKLWYQHEPIEAYFKLGAYDRVIALADSVIDNNNKSVSELYILKGKVYEARGDLVAVRAEYEKAVQYNKSLWAAKEALASLNGQ